MNGKNPARIKKMDGGTASWHGLARLAGTPCDSLKSLLEPFQCTTVREIHVHVYVYMHIFILVLGMLRAGLEGSRA